MELLERGDFLDSLRGYTEDARSGQARLVLISGEAGVGKTSVLEVLQEQVVDARWMWGACDGSFTPQPLGPLFDIAPQIGGEFDRACRAARPRNDLFRLLLDELSDPARLSVLVIEDVHWADEATLDLLRFLGRRIRGTRTLLLLTYRDDALAPDHRLRAVLGELATQRTTRRIGLPPLSKEAVAQLVRESALNSDELFEVTGGNPFYLTEILQAGAVELPKSAQDAVLARVSGISERARHVLNGASVIGVQLDLDLVSEVVDLPQEVTSECLDESLACGALASRSNGLHFRHEIARRAIEASIPAHRLGEFHRRTLRALEASGSSDDARMAHHAEVAKDTEAVRQHACAAAVRADALAAHREAGAQYQRALRFADGLSPTELARLYEALAEQKALTDSWEEVVAAREQALELWRETGDQIRVGDCLRLLSRAYWRLCRGPESQAATVAALEILERQPSSVELAWAHSAIAGQYMSEQEALAISFAKKAEILAVELVTSPCSAMPSTPRDVHIRTSEKVVRT